MTEAHAALPRADRLWIRALGALLPAAFRERQRGEWAADLLTMAHDPAARRSYLLGAIRTLPMLRAAARGHESVLNAAASGTTAAITASRLLATMMAWSVSGWLTAALVPYLIVSNNPDADLWGWAQGIPDPVALPPAAVLFWGALSGALPYVLSAATGLVAFVLACTERRRGVGHRLGLIGLGTAMIVLAWAQVLPLYLTVLSRDGFGQAMLALATLPLLTRRASLSRRRRLALGILAALTAVVAVVYQTPFGYDMGIWLRD
ncbi:hypothetical protein [Actinoplanes couchii]|uniref:Integral membrane protein n=1 Tax=Actinoplanes couchii TaxID=403638 RepID=A0ABQ3XNK8_9ACTN|nr:hypothetical protein [Actinoplanes couchii]MDR6319676.1 hypothetical protein [Actinoplanes couchii]GID60104.1 hypothetical protein Aco03nite_085080 [Actinoplanes couchii]